MEYTSRGRVPAGFFLDHNAQTGSVVHRALYSWVERPNREADDSYASDTEDKNILELVLLVWFLIKYGEFALIMYLNGYAL